ncbi:hypothetical protein HNQ91_002584 [Filimonas zeae]|nr:hypothetical protein [Filimonas zeae]MDR6339533.1 hypothetical protein [Filimonas zeae]
MNVMKNLCRYVIAAMLVLFAYAAAAMPANPWNLLTAPGSVSATTATILWDKQEDAANGYQLILNGKPLNVTRATNYILTDLQPATTYKLEIGVAGVKAKSPHQFPLYNYRSR